MAGCKKKYIGILQPILFISLLFAAKAFYLAFWVTPLWDIPDEIGHFSYVRDIAEGRGIPLYGKAQVAEDIMRHINKDATASPVANWIAQHPPAYHLVAASVYKIGRLFTADVEILYRLPRLVSVISGALLILVLFNTLLIAGVNTSQATAIAASISFIPMVSHLSSGTNHDISLFLFCALATYYFARYIMQRNLADTYCCALWLAIAGGTKMTAWVLVVPVVSILLIELPGPLRRWVKNAMGISLIAFSIPVWWMVRNIVHFGYPFYPLGTGVKRDLAHPVAHGFFEYLHTQPAFEQFILSFYGLFGWAGTGGGQVESFLADGLPRAVFSLSIFILACISIIYLLILAYRVFRPVIAVAPTGGGSLLSSVAHLKIRRSYGGALMILVFLVAFLAAGFLWQKSYAAPSFFGSIRILTVSLLVFSAIAALALLLFTAHPSDRLALYGFVVMLFFGVIVLRQVYRAYLGNGQLRATHGRYFFPVVPILLLSFAVVLKRLRIPSIAVAAVAASFAYMELETFVLQALPFYLGEDS